MQPDPVLVAFTVSFIVNMLQLGIILGLLCMAPAWTRAIRRELEHGDHRPHGDVVRLPHHWTDRAGAR
ncbi:MAG: hypothetical protein GEU91_18625 [Rhizobiales bacterium]|nr:hypothetical protein [Hyphomicrobiales bacterium]